MRRGGHCLKMAPLGAGGDVRELDFQFNVGDRKIGAPFHGLKAFFTTPQLSTFDKVTPPLPPSTVLWHRRGLVLQICQTLDMPK